MERGGVIESGLAEEVDGTGGGYGRYPGLTVAQVAERFRFFVDEGHGRSARGILRLVHEQVDARGNLGVQRLLAGFGLTITVAVALFRMFVTEEAKHTMNTYLAISAGVTVLFLIGAVSVQKPAARGEAQVREIRRLALESLDALVSREGFTVKPLEREHIAALNTLKKSDPATWSRVREALGA